MSGKLDLKLRGLLSILDQFTLEELNDLINFHSKRLEQLQLLRDIFRLQNRTNIRGVDLDMDVDFSTMATASTTDVAKVWKGARENADVMVTPSEEELQKPLEPSSSAKPYIDFLRSHPDYGSKESVDVKHPNEEEIVEVKNVRVEADKVLVDLCFPKREQQAEKEETNNLPQLQSEVPAVASWELKERKERKRRYGKLPNKDSIGDRLLDYLQGRQPVTIPELQSEFGIRVETLNNTLNRWMLRGVFRKLGPHGTKRQYYWCLPETEVEDKELLNSTPPSLPVPRPPVPRPLVNEKQEVVRSQTGAPKTSSLIFNHMIDFALGTKFEAPYLANALGLSLAAVKSSLHNSSDMFEVVEGGLYQLREKAKAVTSVDPLPTVTTNMDDDEALLQYEVGVQSSNGKSIDVKQKIINDLLCFPEGKKPHLLARDIGVPFPDVMVSLQTHDCFRRTPTGYVYKNVDLEYDDE